MKTGEIAIRFKLDPKTVKAWTDEFGEFFTNDAKGTGRTQRFYHMEDRITLNTIRIARLERRRPEEIRAMLAAGDRHTDLPPEFTVIEGDSAMTVYSELKTMQVQIDSLNAEIERLREEKERDRTAFETDRQRYEAKMDTLNQEVGKWRALYGDLKERMEKDAE